ncbi:MAG TPA: hydantoinase/oxoprolinase family protein [Stellaceae bacterium]|nr:hydantoinase/oxoprolinase family protein [Stellaceae bacterium]
MSSYLRNLKGRLRDEGFRGRLLAVSSLGGVVDAEYMASAPIHSVKSGPSVAPIAGRHYAISSGGSDTAIVADTGGTSYDVTLVHRGEIPFTRETWLGLPYRGHMTGFPSVDVKSIGAGGGSIAWVDDGGMLHVGPESAGSVPGPVCYGKGGARPTVTDAALALGYLDPDFFLDGAIRLDHAAASDAIARLVAAKLAIPLAEAANAIIELATENMVRAIEDITIDQGIDPKGAILIGGGGAAGLNAVRIARRLGCPRVIIPPIGATLSAGSALMSDIGTEFSATQFTTSHRFDFDAVNRTLSQLERQCLAFIDDSGAGSLAHDIEYFAEARYPHQIWEVEIPVQCKQFASAADVRGLVEALHRVHEQRFSFRDADSDVEVVTWRARVTCRLPRAAKIAVVGKSERRLGAATRVATFPDLGQVDARVFHIDALNPRETVTGPAIVESSFTTVVIDPKSEAELTSDGSLSIRILS